jgi:hypothetical protein
MPTAHKCDIRKNLLTDEVYRKGLNIYALVNHLNRKTGDCGIPQEVVDNICKYYLNTKKPILNQWAWFVASIHRARQDYIHNQLKQKKEIPQSIRDLLKSL